MRDDEFDLSNGRDDQEPAPASSGLDELRQTLAALPDRVAAAVSDRSAPDIAQPQESPSTPAVGPGGAGGASAAFAPVVGRLEAVAAALEAASDQRSSAWAESGKMVDSSSPRGWAAQMPIPAALNVASQAWHPHESALGESHPEWPGTGAGPSMVPAMLPPEAGAGPAESSAEAPTPVAPPGVPTPTPPAPVAPAAPPVTLPPLPDWMVDPPASPPVPPSAPAAGPPGAPPTPPPPLPSWMTDGAAATTPDGAAIPPNPPGPPSGPSGAPGGAAQDGPGDLARALNELRQSIEDLRQDMAASRGESQATAGTSPSRGSQLSGAAAPTGSVPRRAPAGMPRMSEAHGGGASTPWADVLRRVAGAFPA